MDAKLTELIGLAAAGRQEQMDELIKTAQPRIRSYILRCTLNEDLTEDLLQETMLQLLVSIKSLKNAERFWPWLYKIASNKVISYFRKNKHHSSIQFSAMEDHLVESALQDTRKTVDQPARQELYTIILNTMEKLSPTQRSVLSLRCFEGMKYQEIAAATGYSETTARVNFLRARQKLKSSLRKQGLSKKAVLPALVLFGKLTAEEAVAAAITPATVTFEMGLTAAETIVTAIKAYLLKTALATLTITTTVVVGHAAWEQISPSPFPPRNEVQSVHYTVQGIGLVQEDNKAIAVLPANRSRKADVDVGPYYCKGAYEQWLQFPDGPDGPVLVRMQRWGMDPKTHETTDKQCGWLQNGRANYYYYAGDNTLYITNDPVGMLILPTDSPEMVDFLSKYSQYQDSIKYTCDRKTGLAKAKKDNRVPSVKNYNTEYVYNTLSEQDFEPFWPKDAGVIDQRDPMHYRGWTYFTIAGNLGDLPIRGKGQIPFSYNAFLEHKPWLDLQIGDSLRILDTARGACLIDEDTGQTRHYPSGTFFVGLGRPWSGIRAYDTLRRDAAEDKIPFSDKRVNETGRVLLERKLGPDTYTIQYTVDMAKDVTDTIQFVRSGTEPAKGKLKLAYAQELEDLAGEFEEPRLPQVDSQQAGSRSTSSLADDPARKKLQTPQNPQMPWPH